ncbi:MAG: hypothetical protein LCH95_04850 [Proteobacteria bacterium]|nr:hypothetical protein [Pseudomonadota bacterium]
MNENEIKVLSIFRDLQLFEPSQEIDGQPYRFNDDGYLVTYKTIERDIGLPKGLAKPILLDLRNRRLIELSPGVDCDGMISGSGYMLTSDGLALINNVLPYKPN